MKIKELIAAHFPRREVPFTMQDIARIRALYPYSAKTDNWNILTNWNHALKKILGVNPSPKRSKKNPKDNNNKVEKIIGRNTYAFSLQIIKKMMDTEEELRAWVERYVSMKAKSKEYKIFRPPTTEQLAALRRFPHELSLNDMKLIFKVNNNQELYRKIGQALIYEKNRDNKNNTVA